MRHNKYSEKTNTGLLSLKKYSVAILFRNGTNSVHDRGTSRRFSQQYKQGVKEEWSWIYKIPNYANEGAFASGIAVGLSLPGNSGSTVETKASVERISIECIQVSVLQCPVRTINLALKHGNFCRTVLPRSIQDDPSAKKTSLY